MEGKMRCFNSILAVVVIAFFQIANAAEPNHKVDLKIDLKVEKFKLPNGMTVLLHENRSIPMVSYQTWFRVGSRDEDKAESGLAHMLEHMMFKGAKKYTNKDFDRILHENGIYNNAFTTHDYTGYYENLPSNKLELIMDVEVDRLMNLALKNEDLQSEREVVKEERRMRVDNDPNGILWENLFKSVFEKHPYGVPTIGYMEDINGYTQDKLKAFFNKWYSPANAVLVIVGDFDTTLTRKLIEKNYSIVPARKVPEHQVFQEPEQKSSRFIPLKKNIHSSVVAIGYLTPGAGRDEAYALDLLSAILGQGKSSRLFQKLTYKEQTTLYATSSNYTPKDYGIFFVEAILKPGVKPEVVEKSILSEIEVIRTKEVSDTELQKVKNQVMSDYLNSLKTNDGKARMLATNEVHFGDYKEFFKDLERYKKVTSKEILALAKKYLGPDQKNIVHLLAEGDKK
jgi:zinc protease